MPDVIISPGMMDRILAELDEQTPEEFSRSLISAGWSVITRNDSRLKHMTTVEYELMVDAVVAAGKHVVTFFEALMLYQEYYHIRYDHIDYFSPDAKDACAIIDNEHKNMPSTETILELLAEHGICEGNEANRLRMYERDMR